MAIRFIQIGLAIAFTGSVLLLASHDSAKPLPLSSVPSRPLITRELTNKHKQGFTNGNLREGQYVKRRSPVIDADRRIPKEQQLGSSKLRQGIPKPSSNSTSGLEEWMPSSAAKQQTVSGVQTMQQNQQGPLSSVSLHGTPQKEQKTVCTVTVTLPQPVMAKIKSYIFFIGHARSGHSIVGSILDSHPHIVVSHEFNVFGKLLSENYTSYNSKTRLFNALWKNSCMAITDGWRTDVADKKGYTLKIPNLYQGAYQSYIDVIGDKRGGLTSTLYMKDSDMFESTHHELKSIVNLPMKVIHVIRNPYDNIATAVLFNYKNRERVKITTLKESNHTQPIHPGLVDRNIVKYFKLYNATEKIKAKYNLDVLEVHGKDLIADPKKVIWKMCNFLQVSCPDHFLSVCADKVFPEESKTRYKLKWSNDQISAVKMNIERYHNLQRYLDFNS